MPRSLASASLASEELLGTNACSRVCPASTSIGVVQTAAVAAYRICDQHIQRRNWATGALHIKDGLCPLINTSSCNEAVYEGQRLLDLSGSGASRDIR